MKTNSFRVLCMFVGLTAPIVAQEQPERAQPREAARLERAGQETTLTQFDLDFPGGTPGQLVTAIEKAMGRRLNAIVPSEHAEVKLPPLKMTNVDVAHLFQALERASHRTQSIRVGRGGQMHQQVNMGFKTEGPPSDDSIWYFYRHGAAAPSPELISQFYLLTPYLDAGLTVDDITTAIQTGWKMLGETPTPTLSFHQETKLLIAVGEPHQLQTVDQVLNALRPPRPPVAQTADNAPVPEQKPQE